jgi:hypothetical protein
MRLLRGALIAVALCLPALCPLPAAAASVAAPSHALSLDLSGFIEPSGKLVPPPDGEYEDACGVARDSEGDTYIADYYHRLIYVYGPGPQYLTQFADPDPDGPCNLAVDSAGDVYVDNWRRDVVEFTPSEYPPTATSTWTPSAPLDTGRSTGVAIDSSSGRVYVDDRTYVAVYEPSGEPVMREGAPLRIGPDPLASYYGVAVSDFPATAGRVYVADAASDAVLGFDPEAGPSGPAQTIDGAGTPQRGFVSLVDSDLAVDPATGHLYVADDTEPGFEHPLAVVDEFNPAGEYRGQLPHKILDAEPSALTFAEEQIFVTSGNDEHASLLGFGPTFPANRLSVTIGGTGAGTVVSEPAGIACPGACAAEYNTGEEVKLVPSAEPGARFAGWSGGGCSGVFLCVVDLGAETEVHAEFEPEPPAALLAAPAAADVSPAVKSGSAAGSPAPALPGDVPGAVGRLAIAVSGPGVLSVGGVGLRPLRRAVAAGRSVLRPRLDREGAAALAAAPTGRLRVRATVRFLGRRGTPGWVSHRWIAFSREGRGGG